jgi:Rrf2 family protein
MIPERVVLAIAAVTEIAMYGATRPISAKTLAEKYKLAPRHLEPLLQSLVHAGILKGIRGPHGGYQMGREASQVTADEIYAAAMSLSHAIHPLFEPNPLISDVVLPTLQSAHDKMTGSLKLISIETLAQRAIQQGLHLT